MALKLITKVRNIILGWSRRFGILSTPEYVAKVAAQRNKVCEANEGICASRMNLLMLLNGDVQPVDSLVCTKCHCPCKEKALVLEEKCPLNKWPV